MINCILLTIKLIILIYQILEHINKDTGVLIFILKSMINFGILNRGLYLFIFVEKLNVLLDQLKNMLGKSLQN